MEDIAILNLYEPNKVDWKYAKQKVKNCKKFTVLQS